MANTVDILINARSNFDQVKSQIKEIQNGFKGIKLPENLGNKLSAQFTGVNKAIEKYQQALSEPVKTKTDLSNLVKSGKEVDDSFKNLLKTIDSINSKDLKLNLDTAKIDELNQKIAQVGEKYQQALGKAVEKNPLDKLIGSMANDTQLKNLALITKDLINEGDFENAKNRVEELFKSYKKLAQLKGVKEVFGGKEGDQEKAIANLTALKEKLEKFLEVASKKVSPIAQEFDQLNNELKEVTTDELEKFSNQVEDLGEKGHQARETGQQIASGAEAAGDAAVRSAGEIEQLTQRVQYFFGLQNQIQLFKRVVRDAYETVKELDKSMTETAVVTDFSVGDMWAQLPEYTARAKELGATINDLYQANTLYYQQGLNNVQAMQLGTETLKMARIAGMDAAEATDAMTAALRGFNMELNDTSAQRVNDVYSRLAAVTASDTEEISTAVEKTASLAYSAGMDIEQTSAFLAQIIETTREAPETAGTALKTIIARFGEVKKLSDEGLTVGVDAEGEEIDINKVDGALKTAGISLKEFIAGNESLGDVFLRLSERWSTLSVEQQRYIATMAAGARQQSRFIAMMQNVERTQYLMSEAYNAEGASDVQFNKTLEGLDAMLNQLKDEWQQFTMGIANSDLIKDFIKVVTAGLKTINNIISGIGDKVGELSPKLGNITKTFLSLGTFVGGLGGAGGILKSGVNGLAGLFTGNFLESAFNRKAPTSFLGKMFIPSGWKEIRNKGAEFGKNFAKGIKSVPAAFSDALESVISPVGVATSIALAAASVYAGYQTSINEQIKAGEQTKKTYDEINDSVSTNLQFLEQNKKRYQELAQGVGNLNKNISLSEEEYKEFLNINNKIAEISPTLVKGYDSQGNAVLNISTAFEAAITQQELYLKNAKKVYSMGDSALGIARAASLKMGAREYKKSIGGNWYDQEGGVENYEVEFTLPTDINFNNKNLAQIYKRLPQLLTKRFGHLISFDDLSKISGSELEKLVRDSDAIISEVFADDNVSEKTKQNFKIAWDKYISYIQTNLLDSGTELKEFFMDQLSFENLDLESLELTDSGLTEIYSELISDAVYQAQLNPQAVETIQKNLKSSITSLGEYQKNYQSITRDVEDIQKKFLNDMSTDLTSATENYENSISPIISALESWADTLPKDEEAGRAVTAMIREQIDALKNYPEDFTTSITNEYNTMTEALSNASSKLDEYKKKLEGGDYYTLADEYNSILKTMDEDKNKSGLGSVNFWAGAQTMFSSKVLKGGVDEVTKQMDRWKGAFAEGEEGYGEFIRLLYENKDKIKDWVSFYEDEFGRTQIKFDVDPDEDLKDFANELGLTEEALTALINKARQWIPIDFTADDATMYAAYAGMESGVTKGKVHNGKQRLYINRQARDAQLAAQNYDQKTIDDIKERQKNNEIFAVDAKYFTSKKINKDGIEKGTARLNKYIDEMGAETAADVIKALQGTDFSIDDLLKTLSGREGLNVEELNNLTEEDLQSLIDQINLEEENPLDIERNDSLSHIDEGVSALVDKELGITTQTRESTTGISDLVSQIKSGDINSYAAGLNKVNDLQNQINKWEQLQKDGEVDSEEAQRNIDLLTVALDTLTPAVNNFEKELREKTAEESKKDPIKEYGALIPKQDTDLANKLKENQIEGLKIQLENGGTDSVINSLREMGFSQVGSEWVLESKIKINAESKLNPRNVPVDENAGSVNNKQVTVPLQVDSSNIEEETKTAAAGGASEGLEEGAKAGAAAAGPGVKKEIEGNLQNLRGSGTAFLTPAISTAIVYYRMAGKTIAGTISGKAQGMNLNMIPGYAKGRIKGGKETALTGELGYEVAWFPSQGTSTILGLNGPEMVDLPKDAVVFPHEQSKKILKGNKNKPTLGSHTGGVNIRGVGDVTDYLNGGGTNVTVTTDPKTKKNISKATKSIENIEKTTPIGQRNIELKLSQIADRLGLNMDLIKRYLEKPDASEKGLKSQPFYKQYEKDLKRQEEQSLKLEEKYQEQVNSLGKKGKKNANKETVSYGKKGKATVNLNKYIKFNKNTGLYELNTSALKKVGNKSKRNAIAEAAQKLIDDTTSKLTKQRQTTLDAIQKQEELAKLVDDTFYNWEMELKRIHEIQMQMDTLSKRQTRYQSAYELEQARAQAGFSDANSIPNMIASLERQREVMSQQITLSGEKIKEAQDQVIDLLNPKSTQQQAALTEALKYFSYERRPDGTYDYDINTAALEARYNNGELTEEEYKRIYDAINGLKTGMDELEDAVNDNLTTLKQVYDTLNDQRQKLADYEQDILKGLQSEIEEEINNQKNISASITDQLKKLYDEVKKGIELRRRAEDNAKTEADIQKKQQRLMMLRANTAGGNSVEIAQLEKEIGETQQSYQRTLEDQLLQDLQDQADRAAEQRNEQIELTERIKESSAETARLVGLVNEWVSDPKAHKEDIINALSKAYNGEGPVTAFQKIVNDGKVNDTYGQIVSLVNSIPKLEEMLTTTDKKSAASILQAVTGDGYVKVEPKTTATSSSNNPISDKDKKTLNEYVQTSNEITKLEKQIENFKRLRDASRTNSDIIRWQSQISAAEAQLAQLRKKLGITGVGAVAGAITSVLSAFNGKFATGGLNTSTGPAWLDGTPSKPELVLNARDTQNFLALKDILSGIMGNVNTIPDSENAASNTYEININVDHLNNDYDVDKVAERVKKIIVKDSSYRNVTAVRKFR